MNVYYEMRFRGFAQLTFWGTAPENSGIVRHYVLNCEKAHLHLDLLGFAHGTVFL